MSIDDHHEWVKSAANRLFCSGETLWQYMCTEWSEKCISDAVDYARARFPGVCKESLEMPIHGFQIYNADLEVIRSYSAEASDC